VQLQQGHGRVWVGVDGSQGAGPDIQDAGVGWTAVREADVAGQYAGAQGLSGPVVVVAQPERVLVVDLEAGQLPVFVNAVNGAFQHHASFFSQTDGKGRVSEGVVEVALCNDAALFERNQVVGEAADFGDGVGDVQYRQGQFGTQLFQIGQDFLFALFVE